VALNLDWPPHINNMADCSIPAQRESPPLHKRQRATPKGRPLSFSMKRAYSSLRRLPTR
jgi:hypothetical protein